MEGLQPRRQDAAEGQNGVFRLGEEAIAGPKPDDVANLFGQPPGTEAPIPIQQLQPHGGAETDGGKMEASLRDMRERPVLPCFAERVLLHLPLDLTDLRTRQANAGEPAPPWPAAPQYGVFESA